MGLLIKISNPGENPLKKQHYFLVAGKVVFVAKDAEEGAAAEVNCLFHGDHQHINMKYLQRAQRGLQAQIVEKTGPETQFIDVCILNIQWLGFMTPEEFSVKEEATEAAKEALANRVLAN